MFVLVCHGINEVLERFRKELLMFNGMERVTESYLQSLVSSAPQPLNNVLFIAGY